MPTKVSPFDLHFEIIFLEGYSRLKPDEQKVIDKAIKYLSTNPRHPSLNIHKAKNVKGKYAEGGDHVFIAYASKDLKLTFEYGPKPGMISLRNCGHHESSELIALAGKIDIDYDWKKEEEREMEAQKEREKLFEK